MKSLFAKSYLSTAVVLLISCLSLGCVLYFQLYSYSMKEMRATLTSSAQRISTATTVYFTNYLLYDSMYSLILSSAASEDNASILIVDTNGAVKIFADPVNAGKGQKMKNVDMPIVNSLLLGNTYAAIGDLNGYYKNKVFTVGVPIISESTGAAIGAVLVSAPVSNMTSLRSDVLGMFALTSTGVLFLVVLITYFIAKGMTSPLKRMSVAAKQFAMGDFSTRVNLRGKDEIAALGEAFDNMAESLQKTEQARQDFIANVSHEMKTPMTTIAGFVDGILDGTIPADKQSYYLQIISSEVRRLSRLVSRLLFASRLQSGAQELNRVRVDVCELIRRVVLGFEQQIFEKNLGVGLDIPDTPLYIHADLDAITQVIYNLTDNAVKYAYENGKVRISARPAGNKVRIEIFNTGKGIPTEDLSFVFDRFYKSDRSRGVDKESFGLGLYIVKAIVNRHGETVSVSSVPGQSCTFRFSMPLAEQNDDKAEREELSRRSSQRGGSAHQPPV